MLFEIKPREVIAFRPLCARSCAYTYTLVRDVREALSLVRALSYNHPLTALNIFTHSARPVRTCPPTLEYTAHSSLCRASHSRAYTLTRSLIYIYISLYVYMYIYNMHIYIRTCVRHACRYLSRAINRQTAMIRSSRNGKHSAISTRMLLQFARK